jgi:hypothetical protein
MKTPYTYTVLRYIHDIATGEFANVGVILYSPKEKFIGAKCRITYTRLKRIFPNLDGPALKESLLSIQRAFNQLAKEVENDLPFEELPASIDTFAQRILPRDDSSLQWSGKGSGLTSSPNDTLNNIFERYVMRYDEKTPDHRRSDEEIWRAFKKEFDAQQITDHLISKTISGSDDEKEFQHAWKNGIWHCIEPVSLDLASSDSMKDKAIKWLGQMETLRDGASEKFKVYFLVGEPSQKDLRSGFDRAIRILGKAKGAEIVTESEAETFSKKISSRITAHNKSL